jgi:hypothetical protein
MNLLYFLFFFVMARVSLSYIITNVFSYIQHSSLLILCVAQRALQYFPCATSMHAVVVVTTSLIRVFSPSTVVTSVASKLPST